MSTSTDNLNDALAPDTVRSKLDGKTYYLTKILQEFYTDMDTVTDQSIRLIKQKLTTNILLAIVALRTDQTDQTDIKEQETETKYLTI